MATAAQVEPRPYRLLEKAFFHDRLMRPGEVVWCLPHEVAAHHQPVEQSAPVTAPADVHSGKPSRPRRRRSRAGAVYGSDIAVAEEAARKLRGFFRFCWSSNQWFRRNGRRWLMASPAEPKAIVEEVVDEVARDAASVVRELRQPGRVAGIMNLVTVDPKIARPGHRP